jgi:hypothetical protein
VPVEDIHMEYVSLILAPILAAVIGFLVWFLQNRISKIQEEQDKLFDQRREIYAEILEPFIRIHVGASDPEELARASAQLKSIEFKRNAFRFSLIAEDEVVRSFNDMIGYIASFGNQSKRKPDGAVIVEKWGAFLLVLRKSFGNKATELTERDVLRCLLNKLDDDPEY